MRFASRLQAAELLAQNLSQYQGKQPLVLGIPRGAIPMAKVVADRLGGELDVVLVHKIGAPDNPELAIGSVSEFGAFFRSGVSELYNISLEELENLAIPEMNRLKQRRQAYSPVRPPINPQGRTVIIIDDGIATGSTMLAAMRAVRSQNPREIVVAAPVASRGVVQALEGKADDVVILFTPVEFFAISQFYERFEQISDQEVLQILSDEVAKKSVA